MDTIPGLIAVSCEVVLLVELVEPRGGYVLRVLGGKAHLHLQVAIAALIVDK